MVVANNMELLVDFSLCKEMFKKFGERRLIGRGEYFARSGEVMELLGGLFWEASQGKGITTYILVFHARMEALGANIVPGASFICWFQIIAYMNFFTTTSYTGVATPNSLPSAIISNSCPLISL